MVRLYIFTNFVVFKNVLYLTNKNFYLTLILWFNLTSIADKELSKYFMFKSRYYFSVNLKELLKVNENGKLNFQKNRLYQLDILSLHKICKVNIFYPLIVLGFVSCIKKKKIDHLQYRLGRYSNNYKSSWNTLHSLSPKSSNHCRRRRVHPVYKL